MLTIKLTELSVLGGDADPITVFPNHIGFIKEHEDGGSWIGIDGKSIRVAQTEAEIMDLWRSNR